MMQSPRVEISAAMTSRFNAELFNRNSESRKDYRYVTNGTMDKWDLSSQAKHW